MSITEKNNKLQKLEAETGPYPKLEDCEDFYAAELPYLMETYGVDEATARKCQEFAHYRAVKETDRATFQAMEALIDGRIETFAWGKLIRRESALQYPFPRGKVFEDHFWTHFVFAEARKVALLAQPLVHYRQRDNSISFTFDRKRLDMLEGWINRKEFLEQRYPDLLEICYKRYAERYAGLAWLVLTRMKGSRREAFRQLRAFNSEIGLQNYAEGTTKQLIGALDRGDFIYAVYALWFRLVRR